MNGRTAFIFIVLLAFLAGFTTSTLLQHFDETPETAQKYYVAQTGNIIEFCPEPASSERCLIFEVV